MKENRSFLFPVWGALILAGLILVLNPLPVGAVETCNIITVNGRSGVTPNLLNVAKGDCVVWMNWTRNENVSVVFKEGGKCVEATKSPVHFAFEKTTGCFLAQELDYGETASLVFNNPGTYDYEIQFKVGGSIRGSIVVKE